MQRMRQVLAKRAIFQITIPITTAGSGGSVQQCLSAADTPQRASNAGGAADKLYSLGILGKGNFQMKVLDHEPQWWFLLEDEGALFLDANCNHSFVGYDFLLRLDAEETAKYRTEGRAYISWLADAIQNSAPILEGSKSKYKGRDLSKDYSERVTEAVNQWRQGK